MEFRGGSFIAPRVDGRKASSACRSGMTSPGTRGPERAIGAVVNTACTVVAPGVIQVAGRMNRLILGEPSHTPSERVTKLAEVLRQGWTDDRNFKPHSRRRLGEVDRQSRRHAARGPHLRAEPMDVYDDAICVEAIRHIDRRGHGDRPRTWLRHPLRRRSGRLRSAGRLITSPAWSRISSFGRTMEIDSMLTVPLTAGQGAWRRRTDARFAGRAGDAAGAIRRAISHVKCRRLTHDSPHSHRPSRSLDFSGRSP